MPYSRFSAFDSCGRTELSGTSSVALSGAICIHELHRQVSEVLGIGARCLLVVRAFAVPAFGDLVVEERLVKFLHARGKLARVNRPHPIVLRGGKDQWLRIIHIRPQLVVRRNGREERALLW